MVNVSLANVRKSLTIGSILLKPETGQELKRNVTGSK